MLTDLNAGNSGLNRLRWPTVRVTHFQIERVRLSRSTRHPEQNERLVLRRPRVLRRLGRSRKLRQPPGVRHAKRAGERKPHEVATRIIEHDWLLNSGSVKPVWTALLPTDLVSVEAMINH